MINKIVCKHNKFILDVKNAVLLGTMSFNFYWIRTHYNLYLHYTQLQAKRATKLDLVASEQSK